MLTDLGKSPNHPRVSTLDCLVHVMPSRDTGLTLGERGRTRQVGLTSAYPGRRVEFISLLTVRDNTSFPPGNPVAVGGPEILGRGLRQLRDPGIPTQDTDSWYRV